MAGDSFATAKAKADEMVAKIKGNFHHKEGYWYQ